MLPTSAPPPASNSRSRLRLPPSCPQAPALPPSGTRHPALGLPLKLQLRAAPPTLAPARSLHPLLFSLSGQSTAVSAGGTPRIMARSTACNGTASVRPSATPPPQQFPGAPASSRGNPSPPPHFYPGAPKSSSPNPSTPPPFYPSAPTSSSTNPCVNQWRPVYTPAPEGLLNFGQIPAMHMYNYQPPSMHHHEQGNQRMENLHFVGTSPYDAFSTPPPPPHPKATSQSAPAKVKSTSSKRKRNIVNVDDDEPSKRTAQRLSYTPEEYVRLANAWLECSMDPVDGNGKKGEKFWDEITVLYNSTTPTNRKRDHNQLKQEWQRTKKRLSAFHGEWIAVNGVYESGVSTVDLETMAMEKYEDKYGHPFQHFTMWVKLRDEGKWLACYNRMTAKEGKSPSEGTNLPSNVFNLEDEKRPLAGRDKAKAERAGKVKAREVSHELGEKLDKFIEVNNQSMEERQKVKETQVFLSNRQLETAKITNKTKMLDVYQKLLLADTSLMDDSAKAGRLKALKSMESTLFSEGNSGDQGE